MVPAKYAYIFTKATLKERLAAVLSYKELKYRYAEQEHTVQMDNFYHEACEAYIVGQQQRWAFRRLVVAWRRRQADKAAEPSIDLVTLDAVRQPIHVYAGRRRYTFEARSIAQSIQVNLLYSRDGFPQPAEPKNIFTNEAFTYQQMVSIYFQLRAAGRMSWPLAYYKECDFRAKQFAARANVPVTLRALRDEICGPEISTRGRDIIMAFIEYMVDEHAIQRRGAALKLFEVALELVPNHPIVAGFRMLAYADMEAETLGGDAGFFLSIAARGLLEKRWMLKRIDAVQARL